MDTLKVRLARRRLHATRIPKLVAIWLIILSSGCGVSMGDHCVGFTSFMVEHNRKVKQLHDSYTPEGRYRETPAS